MDFYTLLTNGGKNRIAYSHAKSTALAVFRFIFCISRIIRLMLKKLYQFQAQAFPKVFSSSQPFFHLKDEAPNRILSTENEYARGSRRWQKLLDR